MKIIKSYYNDQSYWKSMPYWKSMHLIEVPVGKRTILTSSDACVNYEHFLPFPWLYFYVTIGMYDQYLFAGCRPKQITNKDRQIYRFNLGNSDYDLKICMGTSVCLDFPDVFDFNDEFDEQAKATQEESVKELVVRYFTTRFTCNRGLRLPKSKYLSFNTWKQFDKFEDVNYCYPAIPSKLQKEINQLLDRKSII